MIDNYDSAVNGRIWGCWDPTLVDLIVVSKSDQVIHCAVTEKHSQEFFFCSIVYAHNEKEERRSLWAILVEFSCSIQQPWVILGDFNTVRIAEEKVGGRPIHPRAIRDFQNCLFQACLTDLKATGCRYTWSNRSFGQRRVLCKLDRCLINSHWLDLFAESEVDFLPQGTSDHSPMILTRYNLSLSGRRPLKFYNAWVEHPDFFKVVRESWNSSVAGNPMLIFTTKLKRLKKCLREWSKDNFSDLKGQILKAKEKLVRVQGQIQTDPLNSDLAREERTTLEEYARLSRAQESNFRQKARINWLQLGDNNSKCFFQVRRSRNRILSVHDQAGTKLTNMNDINREVENDFRSLLGTPHSTAFPTDLWSHLRFEQALEDPQISCLDRDVSEEEIKDALFSMDESKALALMDSMHAFIEAVGRS